MSDIIEKAKYLIKKGKELNDPELIQMGTDLLDNSLEKNEETTDTYKCSNCGYEMPYDKPDRKKCPKCKKHKLIPNIVTQKDVKETESFEKQIRNAKDTRIRYDEDGKPAGKYTKTEQIEGVTNIWDDNLEDGKDEANELLKKFTQRSPRTRQPVKYIEVVCDNCKKTEKVHPLHAAGRARYLCHKCIGRRSQV